VPTAVRVLARFARCRSPEDAHELAAAIAKQSRPQTNAVAGYDLTFSPVKSVSTLWALAELTVCPPSTTVACPVTKVAASEQSHSTGGGDLFRLPHPSDGSCATTLESTPAALVLGQCRLAFSAMTMSPSSAPTAALPTLRIVLSPLRRPRSCTAVTSTS
jgi:TrwC relaxase